MTLTSSIFFCFWPGFYIVVLGLTLFYILPIYFFQFLFGLLFPFLFGLILSLQFKLLFQFFSNLKKKISILFPFFFIRSRSHFGFLPNIFYHYASKKNEWSYIKKSYSLKIGNCSMAIVPLSRPRTSRDSLSKSRQILSRGKILSLSRCPFVPGQPRDFCPFVPRDKKILPPTLLFSTL